MRGIRASVWIIMTLIIMAAVAQAGAAPARQPSTRTHKTYQVQPGDTLWGIARRYGTTPERLAALNGISTEAILSIGQILRVPVGLAAVSSRATPSAVSSARATTASSSPHAAGATPRTDAARPRRSPPATQVYRVRPGDTLWGIARRHGTTPERLAAMNRISTESILSIGQALRVPAPSAAAARPARPRAGAEPPMTPAMRARLAAIPSRGEEWASTLMVISKRLVGVRYRWGGSTPAGFDCSGFLYYVFGRMGIELPRTTYSMFAAGASVPQDELQVGDIVFFETLRPGPSHAGVYLGDGRFIHSSSGMGRVTITPMDHNYYAPRYLGARRF